MYQLIDHLGATSFREVRWANVPLVVTWILTLCAPSCALLKSQRQAGEGGQLFGCYPSLGLTDIDYVILGLSFRDFLELSGPSIQRGPLFLIVSVSVIDARYRRIRMI